MSNKHQLHQIWFLLRNQYKYYIIITKKLSILLKGQPIMET